LLLRHSNYSATLSKYTPTDCFFGVSVTISHLSYRTKFVEVNFSF